MEEQDHPGLSIAWGTCGHVFHLDCIQRWLTSRSVCPLCNREWEFAKIERSVLIIFFSLPFLKSSLRSNGADTLGDSARRIGTGYGID